MKTETIFSAENCFIGGFGVGIAGFLLVFLVWAICLPNRYKPSAETQRQIDSLIRLDSLESCKNALILKLEDVRRELGEVNVENLKSEQN